MKILLLTVSCLCFAILGATAKKYQVATPEEFKQAAGQVLAGDEIVIANGIYSGWQLTVNTNGTANNPVVIRAEKAGNVVFTGEVNKPVFELTGSYTEISGLTFSDCNVFKSANGIGVLLQLKGTKFCRVTGCTFTKNRVKSQFMPIVVVSGKAEHNRIDHCSFTGNIDNQELQVKITEEAIPSFTLIDHNEFKDKEKVSWAVFNGGECVQIGQEPVMLGTLYPKTTVRDNRFIRCNGEAEIISNKSSGNIYNHNYFEDCHGELVMRGGHDCLIDNNTFKDNKGGIRLNGTHHIVTNNSFTGVPTAIRLMYGMAKGKTETGFYVAASDCVVKNNHITKAKVGILIGDSKNEDWTGKFDNKKYPSRTVQDVAPFDNVVEDNDISETTVLIEHNEK